MIYDSPTDASYSGEVYDYCIIGTGPAGTSVLEPLVGTDARVCILESGSSKFSAQADALSTVRSEGIEIKPHSRERIIGGTSSTWAGQASELDSIDFEYREWVEYSGWPIDDTDIAEYYTGASEKFEFAPYSWFSQDFQFSNVPDWKRLTEKSFISSSTPENFGEHVLNWAKDSDQLDLYLESTVTSLEGDPNSGEVSHAVVRDYTGSRWEYFADSFILACGGIEIPRLLLNSTFACDAGLGNENDTVGRYFMNHPKGTYGKVQLEDFREKLPFAKGSVSYQDGYSGYFGIRPTDIVQREEKILNSYIRLEPVFFWKNFGRDVDQMFEDIYHAAETFPRLKSRILIGVYRLAEKMGGYKKSNLFNIRNFMEMEPKPENRVVLSNATDQFGVPRPVVKHQPTELDKKSMIRIHDIFEKEITEHTWGRCETRLTDDIDTWPIDLDSSHHMGTTRMGNDPDNSVVNENCRLHHSPNVYIAGSSVFPTSGNANPTYTIVALGLRLGRHLASGE